MATRAVDDPVMPVEPITGEEVQAWRRRAMAALNQPSEVSMVFNAPPSSMGNVGQTAEEAAPVVEARNDLPSGARRSWRRGVWA